MAINSLEFRTQLTSELELAIVQKSVVTMFEDNNLRAKFVGAKTVLIPEADMQSLGNYDRSNGFVGGAISVTNHPFKLEQDRGRSFMLDREDEDETGVANLAGKILGEFVRTKVAPEMDAYCLSKLASTAAVNGQTVTGTPATEAYRMFTDANAAVQEVVGYDEEIVCFATGQYIRALESSSEVQRMIVLNDFKHGNVNTKVKSLNGVNLIPVPLSRMKTQFTFYDGFTAGQEEGGYVPTSEAKSVGFIVLPKKACSLVKKSETMRTFTPEQNQKADAWQFDYRIYYDAFLKKTMEKAIYAYVY